MFDFSYPYPKGLVAKYPLPQRDASHLLVLNTHSRSLSHHVFSDIPDFFKKDDVIVLNDSKVFPCRLLSRRKTGGRQEILLLKKIANPDKWSVLVNASHKVKAGDRYEFSGLNVTILTDSGNERQARLEHAGNLMVILNRVADVPLPPYINRPVEENDKERYQTVYARNVGSVAAPTAGLHFTPDLIEKLRRKGVHVTHVSLHVGPGTFQPVKAADPAQHEMHAEYFDLPEECCALVNWARKNKKPVTAVGTTSVRVLEHAAALSKNGAEIVPRSGVTRLFIYPPYHFRLVDRLITNFHQPRSTLLMLVCAFAGREFVLRSYEEAVKNNYRLFSYGDAMLVL